MHTTDLSTASLLTVDAEKSLVSEHLASQINLLVADLSEVIIEQSGPQLLETARKLGDAQLLLIAERLEEPHGIDHRLDGVLTLRFSHLLGLQPLTTNPAGGSDGGASHPSRASCR